MIKNVEFNFVFDVACSGVFKVCWDHQFFSAVLREHKDRKRKLVSFYVAICHKKNYKT